MPVLAKVRALKYQCVMGVHLTMLLFRICIEQERDQGHRHAYQSLVCETAINTDFSELFSLKRIYVKYKNAILSLIDCFVHT